jgi:hypothetical protein
VLDKRPTLGEGHQTLAAERDQQADLAERSRHRDHEPDDFANTAQIAIDYGVIKNEASSDAYIDTYAKAAVEALKADGADVNGATGRRRPSR